MPRTATIWFRPALGLAVCAAMSACSKIDEPTDAMRGPIQVVADAGFDANSGPGAGVWPADGGPLVDGGTGGGLGGGSTAGGTTAGGRTAGGTTGGFTAGGLISGLTAGGILAGGFTAGGSPGGLDAGSTADASVPHDAGSLGDGGDRYADLRKLCVDTINMYRATLGVAPLTRANAEQEACSDRGAKYDGDMNVGHASANAGLCKSVKLPGIQDACPGWPVGGFSGNASLADALTKCLGQMWAEGMPPVSVAACKMDPSGCFHTYGHWINMSDATNVGVACGFYDMGNNKYWMNQDFVSSLPFF